MARLKRLLQLAGALVAFLTYVWFAAVRAAPRIARRKARRRAEREAFTGS